MIGGFNKLRNLPPAVLWSVLAVVIVGLGVGGFFLFNDYIYNEKQGDDVNVVVREQVNQNINNGSEIAQDVVNGNRNSNTDNITNMAENINEATFENSNVAIDSSESAIQSEEQFKEMLIVNDYSDLFVGPFHNVSIADIACNDNYCLLSTRMQDDRIFKFQEGKFTELTEPFRAITYPSGQNVRDINFEWNGEYWLISHGEYLVTYDGRVFENIYSNQNNQFISAVAWNNDHWQVGLSPSWGNNIKLYVMQVNPSHATEKVSTPVPIYELLSGEITSISWNGDEWMIGGYRRDINSDNYPLLGLYSDTDGEFTDVSSSVPVTGHNQVTGIEWYANKWLISFWGDESSIYYYSDGTFGNISAKFSNGAAAQSMDSQGNIASFVNNNSLRGVIYNSEVFDLSDLWTKPLHTTVVHGNKVYWAGAMGLVEIIIAH